MIRLAKQLKAKVIALSVVSGVTMFALSDLTSATGNEYYEDAKNCVNRVVKMGKAAGMKVEPDVREGIVWGEKSLTAQRNRPRIPQEEQG